MKRLTQLSGLSSRMLKMAFVGLLCCAPSVMLAQTPISDEAGLKAIADDLGGHYQLTADITLSGDWTPIGTAEAPFTGIFDGNGFVINGLKVDTPEADKVGLFGAANGAQISKVGLVNVSLAGKQDVAGIVGNAANGTVVEGCFVSGIINGADHVAGIVGGFGASATEKSRVKDCFSTALIISSLSQAGGIVGTSYDVDIVNCYFSGICENKSNTGGIVALIDNASEVWGNEATNIVASFVASPYLTGNNGRVHRILGYAGDTPKPYTISNSYGWEGTLINGVAIDPEDPTQDPSGMDGDKKSLEELKSADFITSTLAWDATIWTVGNSSLPLLKWVKDKGIKEFDQVYGLPEDCKMVNNGTKTVGAYSTFGKVVTYTSSNEAVATIADGVIASKSVGTTTITASTVADDNSNAASQSFELTVIEVSPTIATAEELDNIRYKLDGEYTLTADIDLAGVEFAAIGTVDAPFTGTIKGEGHIIKNLTINTPDNDNTGFIGAASGATIEKLGFENANVNGNANTGVIVGRAAGTTVSQCYVGNSYVEGRDHVAAIIGGTMDDCLDPQSQIVNTLMTDCYSNSEVYSRQYQAAGLMGTMIAAVIENSYFSGIARCPGSNVGGVACLVDKENTYARIENSLCLSPYLIAGNGKRMVVFGGETKTAQVINCYSLPTTAYGKDLNSLTTPSVEEMGDNTEHGNPLEEVSFAKDETFYAEAAGWDMTNTWKMVNGLYPVLKWQNTPIDVHVIGAPDNVDLIVGVLPSTTLTHIYGSNGQNVKYSFDSNLFRTDGVVNDAHELFLNVTRNPSEMTVVTFTPEADDYGNGAVEGTDVKTVGKSFTVTVYLEDGANREIRTPQDLVAAQNFVVGNYKLMNDIDMTGVTFTGIGTEDNPFTGTFDGQGHQIRNIKCIYTGSPNKKGGLFNVTRRATITNLGVTDLNFSAKGQDVGGIVGWSEGDLISQCYVTGSVNGNDHVGGIVGKSVRSTIENCYFNGDMNTDNYQGGGLAGVCMATTFKNSYVAGQVRSISTASWFNRAGGILGMDETKASEGSSDLTTMNGLAVMANIEAGLAGRFIVTADGTGSVLKEFNKCRYDMAATFNSVSGEVGNPNYEQSTDFAGYPRVSESDARASKEFYKQTTYVEMGWDFDNVWTIEEGVSYPTLKVQKPWDPSGIEDNVAESAYKIVVNGGIVTITGIDKADVSLYNTNGQLIKQTVGQDGIATLSLPTTGIYIVRIVENGKAYTEKVLNL